MKKTGVAGLKGISICWGVEYHAPTPLLKIIGILLLLLLIIL